MVKRSSVSVTQQLQNEFASHLRSPEQCPAPAHLEDRRVQIYRDLVYKNVFSFISSSFPVFKKTSSDSYWQALVRDFIAGYRSESPYFSDLAREFVDFLEQRASQNLPDDPGYMLELAQYEWAKIGLLLAEGTVPNNCFAEQMSNAKPGELINDKAFMEKIGLAKPIMSSLAWPMQFQHAVHKIGLDFIPQSPESTPVFLISYRQKDDSIHFMESNGLTVRMLSLCGEQQLDIRGVLDQLCIEASTFPSETVKKSGLETLIKLAGQDIIGFVELES